jgi:hypothetical protein
LALVVLAAMGQAHHQQVVLLQFLESSPQMAVQVVLGINKALGNNLRVAVVVLAAAVLVTPPILVLEPQGKEILGQLVMAFLELQVVAVAAVQGLLVLLVQQLMVAVAVLVLFLVFQVLHFSMLEAGQAVFMEPTLVDLVVAAAVENVLVLEATAKMD